MSEAGILLYLRSWGGHSIWEKVNQKWERVNVNMRISPPPTNPLTPYYRPPPPLTCACQYMWSGDIAGGRSIRPARHACTCLKDVKRWGLQTRIHTHAPLSILPPTYHCNYHLPLIPLILRLLPTCSSPYKFASPGFECPSKAPYMRSFSRQLLTTGR
jgi:hypothetical protein